MPGEFEPHAGCWMLWPERPDNWRDGAQPAQRAFAAVASAIAQFEPVSVGASAAQYEFARAALPAGVRVVEIASNDAWMRDVGPTCVVNGIGEVRGVDWRFNAWGGVRDGLYFPWDQDDVVARKVLEVELATLKELNGWKGLNMRNQGGTDHLSFRGTGVPGLACDQETDEYRYTHHTQSDTFDHAKPANLIQGAQVMAVTILRVANLPELLPRDTVRALPKGKGRGEEPKKDEPKK